MKLALTLFGILLYSSAFADGNATFCIGYQNGSDFSTTYQIDCSQAVPTEKGSSETSFSQVGWNAGNLRSKVIQRVQGLGLVQVGPVSWNATAGNGEHYAASIDVFTSGGSQPSIDVCLTDNNQAVGCTTDVQFTVSGNIARMKSLDSNLFSANGFTQVYQTHTIYHSYGLYIRQK